MQTYVFIATYNMDTEEKNWKRGGRMSELKLTKEQYDSLVDFTRKMEHTTAGASQVNSLYHTEFPDERQLRRLFECVRKRVPGSLYELINLAEVVEPEYCRGADKAQPALRELVHRTLISE